ncbi:putative beta-glucosidase O [Colletotrichum shisoi]|uniref:alpha-L-rhamnosidase n=1 Tax=Colletotrichum shisoi TaxID=2078593 RepID=A0A5Q4BD76_9PEZI|nr:putative beta-glucosidase O [Colletotrichum shisoi]
MVSEPEVQNDNVHSVYWPEGLRIQSRKVYSIDVRAWGAKKTGWSPWSELFVLETGFWYRHYWTSSLISTPWVEDSKSAPQPGDLFRKEFKTEGTIRSARLYGTPQGVHEAEINGLTRGPIKLAEIYDGEKYDATAEVNGWSSPKPVRRLETVAPLEVITTPSGKTILDFGQNLVEYVRIKHIKGQRGHQITLTHAEVPEKGELRTRPLRDCKAADIYTLRGDSNGESWEPRFSFHGFRYVQLDGWPSSGAGISEAVEAQMCHTDMEEIGNFFCSDEMVNKLYCNIRRSMRGIFLYVPTDCPQRDERLGWTGDLALFAPKATFIYYCFVILKNWLADVAFDQKMQGGVPPMVSPNVLLGHKNWGRIGANAIWHYMVVLAPWALYEETADLTLTILQDQYESMKTYIDVVPRNKSGLVHLWDFSFTNNPGDMSSFNHYVFCAVTKFLVERLAGSQRLKPGWKRSRAQPVLGAEYMHASAEHLTPYGRVSCPWKLCGEASGPQQLKVDVTVPALTEMEVVLPTRGGKRVEVVGSGDWSFTTDYERSYEWPVKELSIFP